MNDECFVPNCKNTIGAPFPRDPEIKQKWLESLQLTEQTPKVGSFICFSHFNPKDLNEETGRRLSNRLKRGAVPCILNPIEEKQDDDVTTPDTTEGSTVEESIKECRTCMTKEAADISVFDSIENDVTIASAFKLCAYPLEISEDDDLPKQICQACLDQLKIAYEFRKKCITTALRSKYKENPHKRKAEESNDSEIKKSCSHTASDADASTNQQDSSIKHESSTSDMNIASSPSEVFDEESQMSFQPLKKKKKSDAEEETVDNSDPQTPSSARRSQRLAHKGDPKGKYVKLLGFTSGIDEIEKNMEEIHGQKSGKVATESEEEDEQEEEDDDENDEGISESAKGETSDGEKATVEEILTTLEEGIIASDGQNVLKEFLKKTDNTSFRLSPHQPQKKIIIKRPSLKKDKTAEILRNIKLPKGVQIKPVEKYTSSVGKFQSCLKAGVYDTVFVQADEYLFELGLVKHNMRHLRCSVPTCSSQAKQRISEDGTCSPTIEVLTPHNHQPPDDSLKKKEMFLCLMRKKMQTDRTLNIRNMYEDACIQDPAIKKIVPIRNVINEICRHQLMHKTKPITSFEDFYYSIEGDQFEKLHFTHSNQQFYHEKFSEDEDGSMAVLFGNVEIIQQVSDSKIMYVDASFKIDTSDEFKYQLVTVLVWVDDSYYPILFVLINKKSQLIFRKVFGYLRDHLAPELRPQEIITDYEANLYYALAEIYLDSNIGGSVFYYTQNLYKKICSLNLSRDLETNSYFRNIYHMLLMLPLLPVNTILDGLNNIELEARNLNIANVARPIFDHVRSQWILNVTPELFCVHKLENRINENVIAPFKKLRDFLLLTKGKIQKTQITILHVIEKLIELEGFLRGTYSKPDKKSFGRDLSSYQKKNVLRAWQFIEDHPKIEISNFFSKVLGYIKCMENQLWIWGFYRYDGDTDDILINAAHFSIVNASDDAGEDASDEESEGYLEFIEAPENTIVMEAMVDQHGVLQTEEEIIQSDNATTASGQQFESAFLKYVYP